LTVGIPEPVRALALHPFRELPVPPEVEVVDLDGARVGINPWPSAQVVDVVGEGPTDLAATVEAARAAARERGKATLAWWLAPEDHHLGPALEALGLVHEDTPGFESIENAMVLLDAPPGGVAEGVEVGIVETWEDSLATGAVIRAVFGFPEMSEEDLRKQFEQYLAGADRGRGLFAKVDGKIVASSYAAFGAAGVNLFGGAVLPEARGRGVYRALVQARWDMAVERGTPALTVQAGRMSRPILERVGFEFVAAVRLYVDSL
jgi:GNAT superfamily N-acetyltransferase